MWGRRMRGVRRMTSVGLGYRASLANWLAAEPARAPCVEITAEHFYDAHTEPMLHELAKRHTLCVHGLGLSLGTPGPIDREQLERYHRVVQLADPAWISEHISYTRAGDVDLGHLNPVPMNATYLDVLVDHAKELADACAKPVILENIACQRQPQGAMSETDFINVLCDRAGCGLLLDVTNLYINSRNQGYDPGDWLDAINLDRIVQIHIVGYVERDGVLHDSHSAAIQDEVLELLRVVVDRSPVRAVTLERDDEPADIGEIERELERVRGALNGH